MVTKVFTTLKISSAILLAVMGLGHISNAHADDPAYYKLTEVEQLTIYKEGENELRPTFSFETVGFQQINPGWSKRKSAFGEFGRHWFEIAATRRIEGTLGLGASGKLSGRLSGVDCVGSSSSPRSSTGYITIETSQVNTAED